MKLIQRKIKFTWCKCYINFYLSRVSHQVAIVLFLLKHISELRYIFPYPIWGQSFVSPSQPNAGYVHAAVSWKRKQLLSKQITQSYQLNHTSKEICHESMRPFSCINKPRKRWLLSPISYVVYFFMIIF